MNLKISILILLTVQVKLNFCEVLLNLNDWEVAAKNKTETKAWTYMESGAFDNESVGNNMAAFSNLRIRPNVMKDVSSITTNTQVLGSEISIPIGIAPSAMQKLWNSEGEVTTVSAVQSAGTFMILSSASSFTIEDVATAAPNVTKWFQMSLPNKDESQRNVSVDLVRRAEQAGYSAIVFTIDSVVPTFRYSSMRQNFDFKTFAPMANFEKYPNYKMYRENRLTWSDFRWIKNLTMLPIVVKGILTREDAREAVEAGVNGIIVSNHGGRQLDGGLATIEALPEIVNEVKGRVEVYVDGGIRSGKDVFKALAIGARAVFIGRPALWGLAVKGREGVEEILNILKKELVSVMGQAGCSSLAKINPKHVAHKLQYAINMINML